ncbi:MAG: hypothetical protein ACXAC2_09660 [Candidatus Kariarchaeaceae archaeon]
MNSREELFEGDCKTGPPLITPIAITAKITAQLLNKMDFKVEKKETITEKGTAALREKERVIREDFVPERKINHKKFIKIKKRRLFFIRFLLKKLE